MHHRQRPALAALAVEMCPTVLEADDTSRDTAYALIRRELQAGYQSYVICPLVEASEADGFQRASQAQPPN
eukprot:scaffold118300_cov36-Prasinocladus_malaysianus.AAC.1